MQHYLVLLQHILYHNTMIKDKKILYIITQTKWGGAQKYVLELAQYFSKHNEVHIAFGETKHINQQFIDKCKELNIHTIPITRLVRNIDPSQDFSAVSEIKKILNKGNYNLLHLNSSKAGLLGALAGKLYSTNPMNIRLRIVYTAHGFVFNEPLSKIQKKVYKMSEMFSTNLQNLVITVSDYDRQSAVDNKVCSGNKMFTVHNGIDPKKYTFYDREKALNKLKLDKAFKYFGTIASFYTTKGHKYLVEAINLLKKEKHSLLNNHKFVFIGSGPEQKNIQDLIKQYSLEEYIKIIKSKDNDWKYLKAFNYFILSSVKEGLPYTILEAGLAKLPILTTKVGGIPEILEDRKTGVIVTPGNPLSLLEGIKEIVKDGDKFIDNNYTNILDNFNLNTTLQKTEELYGKMF